MSDKKEEKPKSIVETFTVDPHQSAVAFLVGIQKEGYIVEKIVRKDTTAKVYFKLIE